MAKRKTETDTQAMARIKARRTRRRTLQIVTVSVILIFALTYFTGVFGKSMSALADRTDSVSLALFRGDGYPKSTPLTTFKTARNMSASTALLTSAQVSVYSSSARQTLDLVHGYANPAMVAGKYRLCVYDRFGTGLTIASRTKVLFTEKFSLNILTAAMSENGHLAVALKSEHYYTAQVEVYNTAFEKVFTWYSADNYPVRIALSPNGKTLVAACPKGQGGELGTLLYLLDVTTGEETVLHIPGASTLAIHHISNAKLMVVYDTMVVIYNGKTGEEISRFDFSGASLTSFSFEGGRYVALALAGTDNTRGASVHVLDTNLAQISEVAAQEAPTDILMRKNRLYLVQGRQVFEYSAKGDLLQTGELSSNSMVLSDAGGVLSVSMSGLEEAF